MWIYATLALFSTWKFMFAPMAGYLAGLSFLETLLSCLFGGYLSASFFYWTANYFMTRFSKKNTRRTSKSLRIKKLQNRRKINRRIIKLKQLFNPVITCWLFPLFLSLPIGTIVTAKFYRHQRFTYFYILIGISVNAIILTSITYMLHYF